MARKSGGANPDTAKMNRKLLQYRLAVGGPRWFLRTAWGYLRQASKQNRPDRYSVGSDASNAPSILYLHSGWAIESVGRLWFENQRIAKVTFARIDDPCVNTGFADSFDFVWFGYSSLASRIAVPPEKAILAVHDPAEIFEEVPEWKLSKNSKLAHPGHFRNFAAVIVLSQEMENLFHQSGISVFRIPTTTRILPRSINDIPENQPVKLLTVGRIYKRKNFEQFKRIARFARDRLGIESTLKCDHYPSPSENYLSILDSHSVYVCTSFQEGGPLPVMDAMNRGCAVLSTSVGQIPEILNHGQNGFLCQTDEDFCGKIQTLHVNHKKLASLRKNSIQNLAQINRETQIRVGIEHLFMHLFATSAE